MVVRPQRTIDRIIASPSYGEGLQATSGFALAYSGAALIAQLTGHRPVGPTWKLIPRDVYYFYESMFLLPITTLWMFLFAAFTHQLAKRSGGSGTTERDFTVLAFTQAVPMTLAFCGPDVVAYILRLDPRRYRRMVVIYGPAAMLWATTLSVLGIAKAERLSRRRSLAVVLLAQAASAVVSGVALLVR